MARWILLVMGCLTVLGNPSAWAQDESAVGDDAAASAATETDDESEENADEVGVTEEGRAEFQELENLNALESSSIRPALLSDAQFPAAILAPYAGTWTAVMQDAGLVPELQQGRVPSGSQLLAIPAVRKRFESTQMLGLTVHDQPSVRAYLDFFDGRGKSILAKWIARMGRFESLIRQTLREEGLPEDLIFVAMIESGFSPRATSPAAAVGVWQFIPTTGSEMGLEISRFVDERRDPVKATRAAAAYLKRLHDRFGSWPLALASYNGGPGLMSSNISKFNSNDFWHIQRHGGLYDESRRYVPKIIAAGLVTKNADVFGLEGIQKVAAYDFDVVEVPRGIRLAVFAEACGATVDALRELNPELLVPQTPPGEGLYELRIPKNSTSRFVEKYDGVVARTGAAHDVHEVKFGETLKDIAGQYAIAPRVIAVVNGISVRDRLPYGKSLVIPRDGRGTYKGSNAGTATLIVPQNSREIPGKIRRLYRANSGDTVETLARALAIRPSDILAWNFLDPRAKLHNGMVLQVFLDAEKVPKNVALVDPDAVKIVVAGSAEAQKIQAKSRPSGRRYYHKVRSGESLWTIAKKYRVTVADIKKWNRSIKRDNTLQPGQKLVVFPGAKKRKK